MVENGATQTKNVEEQEKKILFIQVSAPRKKILSCL